MRKVLCFLSFSIFLAMLSMFSNGVVYAGPCELAAFNSSSFTNPRIIDNPYYPLVPGTVFTYEPVPNEDNVINTIEVTTDASTFILGVNVVVVHDYETDNGILSEDTWDWYAQDDDGNVWYFGEDTTKYLCENYSDPACIDKTGSWEAGVDGALPGYLILADPKPGVCYQQESAENAQDMAKVLRLNAKVTLASGASYQDCLETKEWSTLEPGTIEHKYYCPEGGGLVLIEELKGKTVRTELISQEPTE